MKLDSPYINRKDLVLYAVTDRTWLDGRRLYDDVKKVIQGGATMIQLREKNLSHEEFKLEALEIQELCSQYKIPFIINDDVKLAIEIDADGVHVGQSDMKAGDVRALIGEKKILGVSAQTVDEAILAEKNGADYLGVGAVFHTDSKSDAVDVSHDVLKKICEAVKIPVVAIGGINSENIRELSGINLAGVAVISAIFGAKDIQAATRELKNLSQRQQDVQAVESIVREGAKSFSGEQSTKHWTEKTIWFDAAPYASVGIEKAKRVFDEAFGNLKSCDVKILDIRTFLNGDSALVCSIQKWDTVNKDGSVNSPFMMRQTDYFERHGDLWKVLHEHTSASQGWDGHIEE